MMREAVCFSVDLKSIGLVSTYDKLAQLQKKIAQLRNKMYNCKKNGTTAKMYVGIIQEISTTAKQNGTTAKQNVQLQKKKHETHLLQLYIFWQY